MALAFRTPNGLTSGTTTTTTLTIAKPSAVADGDLLVVSLYTDPTTVSTVPGGWTLVGWADQNGASNSFDVRVYWKRAASEGASWDWVFAGSVWVTWFCAAYTGGLAAGDALDGTATTQVTAGSITTIDMPSITTTVDGSMLIAALGNYAVTTWTSGTAPITNERSDVDAHALYDGIQATAGASGTKTFTTAATGYLAGVMLAFKPAAGGATYSRTADVVTAALRQTMRRAIDIVTAAILRASKRTVDIVTAAIRQTSKRTADLVTVAVRVTAKRTVDLVTAVVRQTQRRTVGIVTAALSGGAIARTVALVTAAISHVFRRTVAIVRSSISYRIGRPEGTITTGNWAAAPLWDKVNEE